MSMIIDKNNVSEYGILTDGTPSAEFAKEELQKFIKKVKFGFKTYAYEKVHFLYCCISDGECTTSGTDSRISYKGLSAG